MRAVANSPKFAKKVGVPQSVGKEFKMKDENKMMKKEGRGMAKADVNDVVGALRDKAVQRPNWALECGLRHGKPFV